MSETPKPFLGIVSGERRRDHAEVADRAARIAGGLHGLGVRQGDSVCMLMRNDITFIEAAYAAMRLGAYGVPVNWHFKPEEINYILEDSGTSVLIGHADMLHTLRGVIPARVTVLSVPTPPEIIKHYRIDPDLLAPPDFAIDLESWITRQAPYDGPAVPQPQNMIYTSGTTGHPKGVRRTAPTPEQTRASERMRALIYGLKPGVRALLPGPLYHSAPNSFGLRSGRLGGALVLMPRFEPEEFLRLIDEQKIDTIFMVPTMFIRLLKVPEAVRRKYDVSSLRHIVHAAAPCPADAKRAMIEWWGPVITEYYGSTEAGALTFATSDDALKNRAPSGGFWTASSYVFSVTMAQHCRRGRSARSIHGPPINLISPTTTNPKNAPRSNATVLLPRVMSATSTGWLCLHLRPQARHGDLGRRQHLPRRNRGGAACGSRRP